jgi:hypothetical protein
MEALRAVQVVATAARNHRCARTSARAAAVLITVAPAPPQLAPDFRLYVAEVAVGVPLGILIEAIKYQTGVAPLRLLVGAIGFGSIFVVTAGMGFALARFGRIAEHQGWVTRSFAVAMVFVGGSLRGLSPVAGRLIDVPGQFLETHYISSLWLYDAISLTQLSWSSGIASRSVLALRRKLQHEPVLTQGYGHRSVIAIGRLIAIRSA